MTQRVQGSKVPRFQGSRALGLKGTGWSWGAGGLRVVVGVAGAHWSPGALEPKLELNPRSLEPKKDLNPRHLEPKTLEPWNPKGT